MYISSDCAKTSFLYHCRNIVEVSLLTTRNVYLTANTRFLPSLTTKAHDVVLRTKPGVAKQRLLCCRCKIYFQFHSFIRTHAQNWHHWGPSFSDCHTMGKSCCDSSTVEGSPPAARTASTYGLHSRLRTASAVNRAFAGTKCNPSPRRGRSLLLFLPLPCHVKPL